MTVIRQRLYFGATGGSQVPLILYHLIDSRRPQPVLLLVSLERLLLKNARLDGCVVSCASLLQSDHGVLDFYTNLIDILLEAQFVLPDFEQAGHVVRLSGAIPNRDVQGDACRVIGIVSPGDLSQQI